MNCTHKFLLEILKTSLHTEKVNIDESSNIDFEELLKLSNEHDITSLIYYGIKKANLVNEIHPDILNSFKKQTFFSSCYQINHIKNVTKLLAAFEEKDIKVAILKGLVIRNFYPRPEFRTMGDADIVVQKEKLEQAINIFEELGYTEYGRSPVDITFIKGNSRIELHWNLINPERINFSEEFESEIWNNLIEVKVGDCKGLSLSYEDLAVHLTVHLIKHLTYKGCGIRQFCDLVVLFEEKEDEINWESFWSKIRQYNLEKATRIIFYICSEYLGMKLKVNMDNEKYIDSKYLEELLNEIMNNGIFGKSNEDELISRSPAFDCSNNNSSGFRKYISMFLPPIDKIVGNYSYAKNNKLLIPIAYLHRLIKWTFNKEVTSESKMAICTKGLSIINERNSMLEWLEL